MRRPELITQKIVSREEAIRRSLQWRLLSRKIAFTNGVFDIIHAGHIFSLSEAAKEADCLIVGLNNDASVKRLKGDSRPLNSEEQRALVMASLEMVDLVVLFEEDTPRDLIASLLPDVLVKGGDYREEQIAGAAEVKAAGGRIVINPILEGHSTTSLIEKMNTRNAG